MTDHATRAELDRLRRGQAIDAPPSYVYVASSWRCVEQPRVCAALAAEGIDHYDFRNPREGDSGFSWKEVGGKALGAHGMTLEDVDTYLAMIDHPRAIEGYELDFAAMQQADAFVLVLPCGRSAHLELGFAVGAGKRTAVLLEDPLEPELMYRMVDFLARDVGELLEWLTTGAEGLHLKGASPC